MKKILFSLVCAALLCTGITGLATANDERTITLPAADMKGGKPLMQALAERKSSRSFAATPVSEQDLSNVLWAAFGINRENGKRTVPTAHNKQNVALYLSMNDAIYIYDAQNHAIHKIIEGGLDEKAPLVLIYATEGGNYGDFHIGSMYQNALLYCASAGLNTSPKGMPAAKAHEKLAPYLPTNYTVRMTQPIGMPK